MTTTFVCLSGNLVHLTPQSDIEELKRAVALQFAPHGNLSYEEITNPGEPNPCGSARKTRRAMMARRILCWMLRHLLGVSYPRIAKVAGHKDHSSTLYAIRQANAAIGTAGFDPSSFAGTAREWASMLHIVCVLGTLPVEKSDEDLAPLGTYELSFNSISNQAGADAPAHVSG